jgi:hypothetical protein
MPKAPCLGKFKGICYKAVLQGCKYLLPARQDSCVRAIVANVTSMLLMTFVIFDSISASCFAPLSKFLCSGRFRARCMQGC